MVKLPGDSSRPGDRTTVEAKAESRWQSTFSTLGIHDFRLFWSGLLCFYSAMQMQQVAQGWLVYQMTQSAVALGAVAFAMGLPLLLLSPVGGVAADQADKRQILMGSQVGLLVISLCIAVLIISGHIVVWHLMVVAMVNGFIFAFNMPARQAFIPELVGENGLMNALALNSLGMNLARVVMPGLAGVLISVVGVGGVYLVMAVGYLMTILTLSAIPSHPARYRATRVPLWQELMVGLRYVRGNAAIPSLLVLELVVVLFPMQYQVLMPVFAVDVLDVGAAGLGYLLSAVGIGGLVGSLFVASLGNFGRKGILLLVAGVGFGGVLVLFAVTRSFQGCLTFLALTGLASIVFTATNNILIMGNSAPQLRGRVMSLYMMSWGLQPLAALPVGELADHIGAPATIAIGGAVLVLFALGAAVARPMLRRL